MLVWCAHYPCDVTRTSFTSRCAAERCASINLVAADCFTESATSCSLYTHYADRLAPDKIQLLRKVQGIKNDDQ